MSLYTFHLGQIISTVLGQVDHGGQDGNAAQTRIRDQGRSYYVPVGGGGGVSSKNFRMTKKNSE